MTQIVQFILKYAGPLASLVGPMVGASLAALFGIWVFFRQKEYELVRKRYLEDGIDKIVDQIAKALHLYQQNWGRCFLILKTYRDYKDDTPKDLYSKPFPAVDSNAFLSTNHFLLQQLIRDTVFSDTHQLLLVFLHDAGNIFENNLCAAIRTQIEGGKSHSIKPEQRLEWIETCVKCLQALDEEVQPYWVMLRKLHDISFVLERQRFTFKKLERFHKNKTVLSCIKEVREIFGKEIADLRKMGNKPQPADAN